MNLLWKNSFPKDYFVAEELTNQSTLYYATATKRKTEY